MLAVQNMSACGAISPSHEVEFNALEGSLNMMSKVLNDVLDLCVSWNAGLCPLLLTTNHSHRMDSGKFESCTFVAPNNSVSVEQRPTNNGKKAAKAAPFFCSFV